MTYIFTPGTYQTRTQTTTLTISKVILSKDDNKNFRCHFTVGDMTVIGNTKLRVVGQYSFVTSL